MIFELTIQIMNLPDRFKGLVAVHSRFEFDNNDIEEVINYCDLIINNYNNTENVIGGRLYLANNTKDLIKVWACNTWKSNEE